ncbi:hypothetical protein GQ53DRAFT_748351 [Thozetella sp. PMI_491]|nr:hypothetical protein GQ53DRAFT_748351 [Thozetella sp. PMI_491]
MYGKFTHDDRRQQEMTVPIPASKPPSNQADQPGLEALAPSTLEVAEPRHGLSYAQKWEETSTLPEPRSPLYQSYPPSAFAGSPYTASTSATLPCSQLLDNDSTPSKPPRADSPGHKAIWGVKRQTFWAVVAVGAFTAVVAIALGVGLGVALHKNTGASTATGGGLPPPRSATSTPLPTPTAQSTVAPSSKITCPASNLTLYTTSTGSQKYLLLCGRDYAGAGGAVDISNQEADTMGACIEACAEVEECVGAGWGSYNNEPTCFLKSSVGEPNWSESWVFAIEDENSPRGRALGVKAEPLRP